MPSKTIREVIHDTVRDEMRRDPNVILMGEDVAGGLGVVAKTMPLAVHSGFTRV